MAYNITSIIESVVAATNQRLGLTDPKLMIKFEEGSLTEINNIISAEVRGGGTFPLIWLVTGYTEKTSDNFTFDYSSDLQIFFVDQTEKPKQSTKSKNINKGQIDTMLSKVDTFLYCLAWSKYVNNVEGTYPFDLTKTKLPYFGRLDGQKNKFNKECEAIELSINDLRVNISSC
jgi:hypothetical protein